MSTDMFKRMGIDPTMYTTMDADMWLLEASDRIEDLESKLADVTVVLEYIKLKYDTNGVVEEALEALKGDF